MTCVQTGTKSLRALALTVGLVATAAMGTAPGIAYAQHRGGGWHGGAFHGGGFHGGGWRGGWGWVSDWALGLERSLTAPTHVTTIPPPITPTHTRTLYYGGVYAPYYEYGYGY
jgi:hypothetical protein